MLNLFLRNLMNELGAVTRAIYQDNSKHHPKIEVILENKDDLYHLQINVSNLHLYEPIQVWQSYKRNCFVGLQPVLQLLLRPEPQAMAEL